MRLNVTPELIEKIHKLAKTAASITDIAKELNISHHVASKYLTPEERKRFIKYKQVTPEERETWCQQYISGLATVAELCKQYHRTEYTIRLHLKKGKATQARAKPTDDPVIIQEREAKLDKELVQRIIAAHDAQQKEIREWTANELANIR